MNCREAEQYLCDEHDGALNDTQRAALASHLVGCGSCRKIRNDLEAFVTTWRASASAVRVPNADFEWAKVKREITGTARRTGRRWVIWMGLPSILGAAAAFALYVAPGGGSANQNSISTATVARSDATSTRAAPIDSTVVYVDDKSGWTFVWAPETAEKPAGPGQHI